MKEPPRCQQCGGEQIMRLASGGGWWCPRCRRWHNPYLAKVKAENAIH